jgi:hypothetical protein
MSSTNPNNTLTSAEVAQLNNLEAIVQRGLETDLELGNALAEISDASLYRATHRTFEAYLRDRWDIRRSPENQLSQAAEIADPPCSNLRHGQPAELKPESWRNPQPPVALEPGELLPRLGWLLIRSSGTIADVAHHLETRAADVDDDAREHLRADILALHEELATLEALLEPVDWDAEHGRLLAGEIPPVQDDADDETDE